MPGKINADTLSLRKIREAVVRFKDDIVITSSPIIDYLAEKRIEVEANL